MWDMESLKEKLVQGRFFLHFKPHYDVDRAESVVAVETIVQYQNDKNEIVNQKSFLSEFESLGLIGILDIWVLSEACKIQTQTDQARGTIIPLIINLSAHTMSNPFHIYDLLLKLQEYSIPNNSIQLAINFTTPLLNTYGLHKCISFLQKKRIKIMLNHFGSEFTTLSLFRELAFDKLGIDRQFFKVALEAKQNAILLEQVILLAKSLNIDLICDGIDSLTELQFAKSLGVQYAHGSVWGENWSKEQLIKED